MVVKYGITLGGCEEREILIAAQEVSYLPRNFTPEVFDVGRLWSINFTCSYMKNLSRKIGRLSLIFDVNHHYLPREALFTSTAPLSGLKSVNSRFDA